MPYNNEMFDYDDDFLADFGFADDEFISEDELYDYSQYASEEIEL